MRITVQCRLLSSLSEHTFAGMGTIPALRLLSKRRPILLPTKESPLVPEVSEKEKEKKTTSTLSQSLCEGPETIDNDDLRVCAHRTIRWDWTIK